MTKRECTIPPYVSADDGVVTVLAGCGTRYALSVEAAMRFSEELLRGAARARGQKRMSDPLPAAIGRQR